MDLTINYMATNSLVPYVNNSRTHSAQQVQQVAASIKEFGFTNPILVDEQGGIIAGHGRLQAAQLLGLDQVPTITLAGLTQAQRKAYVIADNKLALNSDWNLDLLRLEVESLSDMGYDLGLLAFGEVELEALIGDPLDLSMLDEIDDAELDAYEGNVKRAIQIEFEADDYDEAQALIKALRDAGGYVGGVIIGALRAHL